MSRARVRVDLDNGRRMSVPAPRSEAEVDQISLLVTLLAEGHVPGWRTISPSADSDPWHYLSNWLARAGVEVE